METKRKTEMKKNYSYTLSTTYHNKNIHEDIKKSKSNFIFSACPLSESIHIGQLYSLIQQDTFKRFLEKKTSTNYKNTFLRNFSYPTYKQLGNQIIQTQKLNKQFKQNNNKIHQLFINTNTTTIQQNIKKTIDEYTFLQSHRLLGTLWSHVKKIQAFSQRDYTLGTEIDKEDRYKENYTGNIYQIKFFVDGKGNSLLTYRKEPYTLFSTVAIAVHPKDRRYKKYIGKDVIVPIINKKIPIISDEEVNMIEGSGVTAINPEYDLFSLKIAQKHELPTKQECIDKKGKFTGICGRFHGKKVTEFKDNVIKLLADIGNLSVANTEDYPLFFNRYSGNRLYKRQNIQYRIFDIQNDYSHEDVSHDTASNDTSHNNIIISSYTNTGGLLPILEDDSGNIYFFDTNIFVKNNSKCDKGCDKVFVFDLLLIHIALEGRLPKVFTVEKFIQLLFEPSYNNNTTHVEKYKKYLSYYHTFGIEKKYILELENILDEIKKDFSLDPLQKLFDSSCILENYGSYDYRIDWNNIIAAESKLHLTNHFFHQKFLLLSLYKEVFNDTDSTILCLSTQEQSIRDYINSRNAISKNEHTIHTYTFDPLSNGNEKYNINNSKQIYTELQNLQKTYGPDLVRVLLLKSGGILSDLNTAPYINRLIQKLWNMCRLVFKNTAISPLLSQNLINHMSDLDTFDIWILDKTYELKNTIGDYMNNNTYLDALPLLEEYIMNYLDHYIEIKKHIVSPYSAITMQYCLVTLLQHIDIYFPLLCSEISKHTNYTAITLKEIPIDVMEYKSNIFNDLIIKIKGLKLRHNYMKHNTIDCIIQCGHDMSVFLNEYKNILQEVIGIHTIVIDEGKQPFPQGYQSDNIIDINIGIKKTEQAKTKKEIHAAIYKQISLIEDEIQRKKILLGKIIPTGNIEKINKKKSEINSLKSTLEDLKLQQLNH